MEFTNIQKKEAFKKLPQEVKDFMFSDGFAENLSIIGNETNLSTEKIGYLEDEAFMVIYGLKQKNDFTKSIEQRLEISHEIAIEINNQVDRLIFINASDKMKALEESPSQTNSPGAQENMDREQILAEIENPTPTIHPISSADQVSKEFVANKLRDTVSTPSQKRYVADPYREPLN